MDIGLSKYTLGTIALTPQSSILNPQSSPLAPFTVIIPARYTSTRLPGKMLADIGGAPMVVRVAQQAQASGAQAVVVATDHAQIAQAVRAHGVQVCMTRVAHASGTDRLAEACELLGLADDALIVNVQGDEPLIDPALIRLVARELDAHSEASMATLAYPIFEAERFANPNVVKVVCDRAGNALYFSRAPIPHVRDGRADTNAPGGGSALHHVGIYAYRAHFLTRFTQLEPSALEQIEALEQLRALWHGHKIRVAVIGSAPAPGVDTQADLEHVRALFAAARV
jgi:3-deoxy-manno-octulosonate cytidylyltransferase (CMP-KDO synthetase)